MKYALVVMIFITSSCSWTTFAPTTGALLGGGLGSIAGPVGGALGGAGGAALGQVLKGEGDVEEAKEQVKALTQGDVGKLIQLQANKQSSTFDAVVDGIYRVLWLLGVGMILWFVIPWVWAKHHVKKAVVKQLNGHTEK